MAPHILIRAAWLLVLLCGAVGSSTALRADTHFESIGRVIEHYPVPLEPDWFFVLRESALFPALGIAILAVLVLAALHYLVIGPKDARALNPGDRLLWYTLTDRVVHGVVALTFSVLFVSGLLISFAGLLGSGTYLYYLRHAHEIAGLVFTPFFLVMVWRFVREALPRRFDLEWFAHAGGYLGYQGDLKAGKFNGGQKLWYWIMAVSGLVLTATGLLLFFQVGHMALFRLYVVAHVVAMLPIVLMFLVHLYMSTLAIRGVWRTMWDGMASRAAALHYHSEARELREVPPAAPVG